MGLLAPISHMAQYHVHYFSSGVLQEPDVKTRQPKKKIISLLGSWSAGGQLKSCSQWGEIGKILLRYLELLEEGTALG